MLAARRKLYDQSMSHLLKSNRYRGFAWRDRLKNIKLLVSAITSGKHYIMSVFTICRLTLISVQPKPKTQCEGIAIQITRFPIRNCIFRYIRFLIGWNRAIIIPSHCVLGFILRLFLILKIRKKRRVEPKLKLFISVEMSINNTSTDTLKTNFHTKVHHVSIKGEIKKKMSSCCTFISEMKNKILKVLIRKHFKSVNILKIFQEDFVKRATQQWTIVNSYRAEINFLKILVKNFVTKTVNNLKDYL